MFAGTDVIDIFPTSVWIHEIGDCERLNDDIFAAVKKLQTQGHGYDRTDGGGWVSYTDLNEMDDFAPLMEYIVGAAQGVLNFLQYEFEHFYITDSWANLDDPGKAHTRHNHPNCVLSGVYYARTPENGGDIIFHDPRPQAGIFVPAIKQPTEHNIAQRYVQPAEGLLMMFPSWLEHSTELNTSAGDRLSISFNIMISGGPARKGLATGLPDEKI
ncbi:MAG: hypothetical protein CMM48_14265 [Rhodospirillaceae bacterium]|nr:hypothetical protein [Rhodospirillaceae bacterium]MBL25052.1 hypothetical protein [Rhodospirillaceae bacterium]HAA92034.1 hypothetical protein [Rhodospirillaceae bacterium]|tara:strand:- start:853 stop:1494 length:642 start_codon:yes stop_codon:yes gene_type:complete